MAMRIRALQRQSMGQRSKAKERRFNDVQRNGKAAFSNAVAKQSRAQPEKSKNIIYLKGKNKNEEDQSETHPY